MNKRVDGEAGEESQLSLEVCLEEEALVINV